MNVAYVLSQGSGGLPHYVAELANAVAKRADVTVLKPTETSADDVFSADVEVVEAFRPIDVTIPDLYRLDVSPLRLARALSSYRHMDRLRRVDPDVVHDAMGLFVHVKLFNYLHGISEDYPFVVTYHELSEPRYPLSHPPMFVSHLLKDALPDVGIDAGIVHTERQAEILGRMRSRPDRIETIPHGAYDFFTEYGHDDVRTEENTVLFFGNVIEEKGVEELVRSIPLVRADVPDVTLVVAGEGDLSAEARRVVDRYPENFEIHDRFVPNDEVGELFSRATLVAVPYHGRGGSKGHSGVLSTAFSFGKPVLASTAGDFTRLVGDSGCGTVVEAVEPSRIADGLVRVLTDADERAAMARESERMAEKLSWDAIAERHVELYERCVE